MRVPGGAKAVDAEGGATAAAGLAEGEAVEADTFYDALKAEAAERTARTRAALAALPPAQRAVLEGHTPGTYLRLLLTGAAHPVPATWCLQLSAQSICVDQPQKCHDLSYPPCVRICHAQHVGCHAGL